jgi:hypothetical protein
MPLVGFESTITVFERAKTVPALHRAANVIGRGGGIDPHIIHLSGQSSWLQIPGSIPGTTKFPEK